MAFIHHEHEAMFDAFAKQKQAQEQQTSACDVGQCPTPRRYTLAEEAEKGMLHHAEAHGKHSAAYEFLTRHPEFDEFVRLVRSGSIQF